MPEPSLVCIGNLTVDEAVSPNGLRVESVGGDALFAALGALLAGGAPRVLAPLGADAPEALRSALRVAGTDPEQLPRRDAGTVRNVIRYAADGGRVWDLLLGEAHFEELSVRPADVPAAALAADGLLLSAMALGAQLELAAWLRPRTAATIYFDPQEDYVAGNEAALMAAVAACDVFLPSEVEAVALAGTHDLAVAIASFLAAGPSVVVMKRAEAGCLVATREAPDPVVVPADAVVPIDSTGAGDAFCGAFAAEHLRSGDPVGAARVGAAAARVAISGSGIDALLVAAAAGTRVRHALDRHALDQHSGAVAR
jgi:sugar/nucleoside kinase (ribokinase family)